MKPGDDVDDCEDSFIARLTAQLLTNPDLSNS